MLKKSSIRLSCTNIHCRHPAASTPPKTSSSQTRYTPRQRQPCRLYAMASRGHAFHSHRGLRWPDVASPGAIPTPYQIFNQKKGSKYSKQTFYELVKLYHPDRHGLDNLHDGLSYATKLERYRLVVAANAILSDPVKRSAYDRYGAGWNGQPDVRGARDSSGSSSTWGSYNGRGWSGGPGSPSQNATWEDWEKWYQRDANGPQEPRYVSNSAFVCLIVVFAAFGWIGQATRVGNYSMDLMEQRDALHNNMSKDLMRRRQKTTTGYGSREERIHSFLRQRESTGYGLRDPREESYRKLHPTPEVGASEDTKERQMHIYRPKSDS